MVVAVVVPAVEITVGMSRSNECSADGVSAEIQNKKPSCHGSHASPPLHTCRARLDRLIVALM